MLIIELVKFSFNGFYAVQGEDFRYCHLCFKCAWPNSLGYPNARIPWAKNCNLRALRDVIVEPMPELRPDDTKLLPDYCPLVRRKSQYLCW